MIFMYYTHTCICIYILYIIKYIYKCIHTYKLYIYSLHSLREIQIKINYEIPKIRYNLQQTKTSRFFKRTVHQDHCIKVEIRLKTFQIGEDYQKHSLCSFLLYIRMINSLGHHIAQKASYGIKHQ